MTYEMLLGEPPFTGPTAQADRGQGDDREAGAAHPRGANRIPPAVEDAVLTALEKLPADRWGSAAEFAEALAGGRAGGREGGRTVRAHASRRPAFPPSSPAPSPLLALGFIAGRWPWAERDSAPPAFTQRSFRDEAIFNARFAPDGKTIVYSAQADSSTPELFIIRPDYPEPSPLGLSGAHLLSISSKGELAVLLRAEYVGHRLFEGTLARVPIGGGAPREVLDSVREADWSPDGTELAIIHGVNGRDRLEFPIGHRAVRRVGLPERPADLARWEARGIRRAPVPLGRPGHGQDRGSDRQTARGHAGIRRPSRGWPGVRGDTEVLFSAVTAATVVSRYMRSALADAIESSCRRRATSRPRMSPSSGQLLLTRDDLPYRLFLRGPGATRDRDVSWLDTSLAPKLSHDGSLLAFTNGGTDASTNYDVMLQKTDGGQVARLGEGESAAFSTGWQVAAGIRALIATEGRGVSDGTGGRAPHRRGAV